MNNAVALQNMHAFMGFLYSVFIISVLSFTLILIRLILPFDLPSPLPIVPTERVQLLSPNFNHVNNPLNINTNSINLINYTNNINTNINYSSINTHNITNSIINIDPFKDPIFNSDALFISDDDGFYMGIGCEHTNPSLCFYPSLSLYILKKKLENFMINYKNPNDIFIHTNSNVSLLQSSSNENSANNQHQIDMNLIHRSILPPASNYSQFTHLVRVATLMRALPTTYAGVPETLLTNASLSFVFIILFLMEGLLFTMFTLLMFASTLQSLGEDLSQIEQLKLELYGQNQKNSKKLTNILSNSSSKNDPSQPSNRKFSICLRFLFCLSSPFKLIGYCYQFSIYILRSMFNYITIHLANIHIYFFGVLSTSRYAYSIPPPFFIDSSSSSSPDININTGFYRSIFLPFIHINDFIHNSSTKNKSFQSSTFSHSSIFSHSTSTHQSDISISYIAWLCPPSCSKFTPVYSCSSLINYLFSLAFRLYCRALIYKYLARDCKPDRLKNPHLNPKLSMSIFPFYLYQQLVHSPFLIIRYFKFLFYFTLFISCHLFSYFIIYLRLLLLFYKMFLPFELYFDNWSKYYYFKHSQIRAARKSRRNIDAIIGIDIKCYLAMENLLQVYAINMNIDYDDHSDELIPLVL
jgi:hypothetical protein